MEIIDKKKNDVLKVLVILDIILLVISFFYVSKVYIITILITNIIMVLTVIVLNKYSGLFSALATTNKLAKGLNSMLHKV